MDILESTLDPGQDGKGVVDETGADDQHTITLAQATEDGEEQSIAGVVSSQGTLTIDPNMQYQLRADTGQAGQVTYRVVQVTQNEEGQTQVVAGVPGQVAQAILQNPEQNHEAAVIQSPFSNGGSPVPDALTEAAESRFTYVPTVSAGGDATQGTVEALAGGATLGQVSTGGGQFYVMMSPQDVLQANNQRSIAPRTGLTPRIEGARSSRDDRRRATHNEVERRRRDKINNWIVQLSKLIPDCSVEHSKSGQVQEQSKGGILAKACDFITDLRTANARMAETLKETERLTVDAELMRQQCEELKQENAMLRAQLQQHGIVPPDLTGNPS